MSKTRFRVTGMFGASRPEVATVTIDRELQTVTVRPLRKRTAYSMTLRTLAEYTARVNLVAEANAIIAARKTRRRST